MRVWMLFVAAGLAAPAWSPAAAGLLAQYGAAGAVAPSAERGRAAWSEPHPAPEGAPRSCATCHTADPRRPGRHVTTGEVLDPLAPSVHADRLSDAAEIEKWFGRNCRWTLGRACTAQEKSDFLAFINQ